MKFLILERILPARLHLASWRARRSGYVPQDRSCAGLVSAKDKSAQSRVLELNQLLVEAGATVLATVIQRRGVSRASEPGGASRMDAPMSPAT